MHPLGIYAEPPSSFLSDSLPLRDRAKTIYSWISEIEAHIKPPEMFLLSAIRAAADLGRQACQGMFL